MALKGDEKCEYMRKYYELNSEKIKSQILTARKNRKEKPVPIRVQSPDVTIEAFED